MNELLEGLREGLIGGVTAVTIVWIISAKLTKSL